MTFLFDLDSTLLQMDQDIFLKEYFKLIYNKISNYKEINADEFMEIFNMAAYKMVFNDGSKYNSELFWSYFNKYDINLLNEIFEDFYTNEFKKLKSLVEDTSISKKIIDYLKNKGYKIILATNPLFPLPAIEERLSWINLKKEDFIYITTYDNSKYSKPNKNYYLEIIENNNLDINDLIMIGNDLTDDFLYLPKEIKKVLITNYMINTNNLEYNGLKFEINDFYQYLINNF